LHAANPDAHVDRGVVRIRPGPSRKTQERATRRRRTAVLAVLVVVVLLTPV
jgi:hypothetical protein